MSLKNRIIRLEKRCKPDLNIANRVMIDVVVDKIDDDIICETDIYPLLGIVSNRTGKEWIMQPNETEQQFRDRFDTDTKELDFAMYEYILDK